MGPKITVDSATLANKGLELIEAHCLFGVPYERIEVVVHPTSIVHALVRFRDGAALAHLGHPDMRVPISYALTYPERAATPVPPLDLARPRPSSSRRPTWRRSRCSRSPASAASGAAPYPCAYNAANEVAVAAFLDGRLAFLEIAEIVEDALDAVDGAPARDLDELVEADAEARGSRGRGGARSHDDLHRHRSGSAFLILVHEVGHFFASLARPDAPAQVLPRLPARARQDDAQRDRVRDRGDPARRLREDPGHAPAGAGDVDDHFGRAIEEAPALAAAGRAPPASRSPPATSTPPARRSPARRAELARRRRSRRARRRSAERGFADLSDALGPDAYWRAPTWKRVAVIFAGPAANILLAIVLFTVLFM